MSSIKLIVGLGNPGQQYQNHRHNLGAIFIQEIAKIFGVQFKLETKFPAYLSKISCESQSVHIAIPTTFMNESGYSVSKICQYYKIKPEEIVVAHDELDIPIGSIRLKQKGGHGGHNGLRHIEQQLGTNNFYRIRIGIGHPGKQKNVSKYVLSNLPTDEEITILNRIDDVIKLLPELVLGKFENVMNKINAQ